MKTVWILLVLFGAAFSAAMVYTTYQNRDLNPDLYGFVADVDGDGRLVVELVQGRPIPMQDLIVELEMDGTVHTHAGTELGLGDEWTVGETACLAGADGCLRSEGGEVTLTLRIDNQTLFTATRTVA